MSNSVYVEFNFKALEGLRCLDMAERSEIVGRFIDMIEVGDQGAGCSKVICFRDITGHLFKYRRLTAVELEVRHKEFGYLVLDV